MKIILASGSKARAEMLQGAGLVFDIKPADIDEAALQGDVTKTPTEIAETLAQQKALAVAKDNPTALVIGGDQVLEFEGEIFSKATNVDEARAKLERLSGKAHRLISAVALVRGNEILWSHRDEVILHMRDLDDEFLDEYCQRAGEALVRAVGGYELESLGSWLFDRIEGDYFTVLGMPLLPLLGRLQKEGVSL